MCDILGRHIHDLNRAKGECVMLRIDSKYRFLVSEFYSEIFHRNFFCTLYEGARSIAGKNKSYHDDVLLFDLHQLKRVSTQGAEEENYKQMKARWQAWADSVTYRKPMEHPEEPETGETLMGNDGDLADKNKYHYLIRLIVSPESDAQEAVYEYYMVKDLEECRKFIDEHPSEYAEGGIHVIHLTLLYCIPASQVMDARYCLLGGIIGDMVGSVYEFNNIKTKDFQLFSERSSYTDDTVMTIAVADALKNGIGDSDYSIYISPDDRRRSCVEAMRRWGQKYPHPMGGYGGRFAGWLFGSDTSPYHSFGNGSAMRVSAAGWYRSTLEGTLEAAKNTAEVTHDHPEGIKGAQATAAAIFLARTGKPVPEIREYIESKFGYDLSRTCDEIRPTYCLYGIDETCQGTVPEALIAAFEGKDFEDVIRLAVSLGGDSDTLACIAGSVAEALYGIPKEIAEEALRRLPEDMRDVLRQFGANWLRDMNR